MYHGAHVRNDRPKRKVRYRVNKTLFALLAIVMVIGAVVGTTVAFLVDKTGNYESDCGPGKDYPYTCPYG